MGTSPHKPSRHHDNTFTIGFFVNQPSTRLPLAMQVPVAHVAQPPRTLFSFFLLYGALSCPSSRLQPGLSPGRLEDRVGESRKVLLHWCNALLTSVSTALNLDRKLFFQSKMGKMLVHRTNFCLLSSLSVLLVDHQTEGLTMQPPCLERHSQPPARVSR